MTNIGKRRTIPIVNFTMILFLLVVGSANAAEQQDLGIKGVGSKAFLVMPESVKLAIQKVVPGFKSWVWQDYLPWISTDILKQTKPALPYAVVADFNNDKQNDLVVDGHTETMDVMVAVVSSPQGYKARIITRGRGVSNPSKMRFYEDEKGVRGKVGVGLPDWIGFRAEEKKRDDSYAFTVNFSLVYDAKGVPNDPGYADFYIRDGKFEMECAGEFCAIELYNPPH